MRLPDYWYFFGIGRSTVCNILHAVSEAIVEKLLPKIIRLPNETEVQTIIREFEEISGFPQAVGAIDGSWRMLKTILTERVITLLFYKELLIIITYFVMYFWDGQENLMMPEYLKIPPFIRSVDKEHFHPEPCLDIYRILLFHHWYWEIQLIH